jgi:hypothetical protein
MNLEDDNRINRTNNLMGTMEKITEVSQEKLRLLDTEQLLAFAGIFGTLNSPKAKAMVKGISKELQRRKYSLGEEKLNEVDVKSLLKGLGRGAKSAAKGLKTAIKTGYPIAKKMVKATWMLSKKVGGAIGELMDDPEFRKLFTKYVDNPDDPNRAKKIQAYADSMLSSSPVSGMESVDIKLQKARIEKICSVVLGEDYDHDFIYEDIDFTKPSAIKNAYALYEKNLKVIAQVELWNGKKMKKSFKNQSSAERFIKKLQDTEDVRGYNLYAEDKTIAEIEWDPINNKYMGAGSDWMNEMINEKQLAGLKKKSEKSGIAYGILKKVFDRGMAAWKTGHRPGATPHQWAYARVNSFITGGKTRTTADADLWAKHKGKKESIEESSARKLKTYNKLSSAEYEKFSKLKAFNKKDWKWNSKEGLYHRIKEETDLNEIKEPFAVVCDGEVLGTYSKEPNSSRIKALARDNKVDFKKCKVVKTKKQQKVGSSLEESTLNYARTLKAIEKDRKMKNISKKDKETLAKIADLMKKLKEEKACPVATQDLKTNTENRDATIKKFNYGPLNVDEPGSYWKDIAKYWKTTEEAAKKSLCENCVAFDISPRMKDCMPGETSDKDGELGYCWMHHFKCHSARSCHTWAKGGPITDDDTSLDWQKRSKI